MNHITAKAATLSHSLKKNLGVYAPSSSTTDAEFDEASAQLKKTVSQVCIVKDSTGCRRHAFESSTTISRREMCICASSI
jgi:muramoyltetrapeptide carboxypeptidase LdcA involved in peptidoglycan recycling